MKGYKGFNNEWQCNGFQFEIGKEYVHEGEVKLCASGFHFCEKLEDCFKYYGSISWNKFAEVECEDVSSEKHSDDSKRVCAKIKIIKEIDFLQIPQVISGGNNIKGGNNIMGGNYIWGGNNIRV